jgi:hypothetical protein
MYTRTKHKHVNDEEPAASIFKVSKIKKRDGTSRAMGKQQRIKA